MATTSAVFQTGSGLTQAVFYATIGGGDGSITPDTDTCTSNRVSFAWSGRVAAEVVEFYICGYDGTEYDVDDYDNTAVTTFTAKLPDGVYEYTLVDASGNLLDSGSILAKCAKDCCVDEMLEESLSGVDGCRKKIDRANAILQLAESAFEFKSKHGTADALMKLECDGCDNCG